MKLSNMIEVYNQLISNTPNADYSLFKKILKKNFDKFKYFYKILKKTDLENVNKVYCYKSTTHELEISVILTDESVIKSFIKDFESNIPKKNFDSSVFKIDFSENGHVLNILISADCEESEYYEDRFNRH